MLRPRHKKPATLMGPSRPPPPVPAQPHSSRLAQGVAAFALACSLTVGAASPAASLGSPALVIPRPNRLEPYRLFGDRTVVLPLLVYALEHEGLTLKAKLAQLTSNLSAPIGAELEVPLPEFPPPGPGIEVDVSVPLPAVKRETDFELRIWSRRDREQIWHAAGRIALRVYPDDLLSPLRGWAESHPLRVEDDDGSLIQFLRQQGIAVLGGGRTKGFHDSPGVTLYAGTRALRQRTRLPLRENETIVRFTERRAETPHILIERTGRGTAVTVKMRLLDRLATDPLAQKMFLEMFELVNEVRPPSQGDVP